MQLKRAERRFTENRGGFISLDKKCYNFLTVATSLLDETDIVKICVP